MTSRFMLKWQNATRAKEKDILMLFCWKDKTLVTGNASVMGNTFSRFVLIYSDGRRRIT